MKHVFVLLAFALILAGCSVDNPVGREAENPTISTPGDAAACMRLARPLALIAKFDETVEMVKAPNPPEGDFTGIIEIKGIGFCTHLGPSSLYVYEYLDVSDYPTKMYAEDVYIMSLKSGDKLTGWLDGLGYRQPDGVTTNFEGIFHITGGTGALAGSNGEAPFEGVAVKDPEGGPSTGWVKFKGYFVPGSPII